MLYCNVLLQPCCEGWTQKLDLLFFVKGLHRSYSSFVCRLWGYVILKPMCTSLKIARCQLRHRVLNSNNWLAMCVFLHTFLILSFLATDVTQCKYTALSAMSREKKNHICKWLNYSWMTECKTVTVGTAWPYTVQHMLEALWMWSMGELLISKNPDSKSQPLRIAVPSQKPSWLAAKSQPFPSQPPAAHLLLLPYTSCLDSIVNTLILCIQYIPQHKLVQIQIKCSGFVSIRNIQIFNAANYIFQPTTEKDVAIALVC